MLYRTTFKRERPQSEYRKSLAKLVWLKLGGPWIENPNTRLRMDRMIASRFENGSIREMGSSHAHMSTRIEVNQQ
jgi:hypothetical protein